MKLGDWLSSINYTKKNLMRDDEGNIIQQNVKAYPAFVINKLLSYHVDCLPYISILNQYCGKDAVANNLMQYEFLLTVLPKGKRFARLKKPEQVELIDFIMEHEKVSYEVAKGYIRLLTKEQGIDIINSIGGKR